MSELKPCPFCGGKADYYIGGNGYLQCTRCIATIPYEYGLSYEDGKMQAIAKWNRRYQEPSEPLTLEQVKNIGITPVWLKGNYTESWAQFYARIGNYYQFVFCGANEYPQDFLADDYGKTWWAYKRKPESEGRR